MRYALEGFDGGFKIGERRVTNLRYADDIVLIAGSEEELQELISRLHGAARMVGMKINGKKTEVMKVSDDPTPIRVTVAGVPLAETKSFKYLGSMFNSEASCDEEVKASNSQKKNGRARPYLEIKNDQQSSQRLTHKSPGLAYCHIRIRGMDIEQGT